MPTWTFKADRRRADLDELQHRLRSLADTVGGLQLELVDPEVLQEFGDRGNLRDFAPVAHLTHTDVRALEIITEEILLEFGWIVDISRSGDAP